MRKLETNACINGKFLCLNRFYEPKLISTSKLNDGICDCCDGSDEFSLKCKRTCLENSQKSFELLNDDFNQLKYLVSGHDKVTYTNYFENKSELITQIISSYENLKLLRKDFKLISDYLNFVESTYDILDVQDFVDTNQIKTENIITTRDKLYEKILFEENFMKENRNAIDLMPKFSIYYEIEKECLNFSYDKYDCNLCTGKLVCKNQKNWNDVLIFGNISEINRGELILSNGSKCKKYNKNYSSRIIVKCGNLEKMQFIDKVNECEYVFEYNSLKGCNHNALVKIQEKISLYIGELN